MRTSTSDYFDFPALLALVIMDHILSSILLGVGGAQMLSQTAEWVNYLPQNGDFQPQIDKKLMPKNALKLCYVAEKRKNNLKAIF